MKDVAALKQFLAPRRQSSAAWESALWEDFRDEDMDEEEPPFDAEFDDLARGDK